MTKLKDVEITLAEADSRLIRLLATGEDGALNGSALKVTDLYAIPLDADQVVVVMESTDEAKRRGLMTAKQYQAYQGNTMRPLPQAEAIAHVKEMTERVKAAASN